MNPNQEKQFVFSAALFADRLFKFPAVRRDAEEVFSKLTPREITEQLPDILEKLAHNQRQRNENKQL